MDKRKEVKTFYLNGEPVIDPLAPRWKVWLMVKWYWIKGKLRLT